MSRGPSTGRWLAAAEGVMRTVTQLFLKPYSELTASIGGGGLVTAMYGALVTACGAIGSGSPAKLFLRRSEVLWICLLGLGSSLRSIYYYGAYLWGAPEVIPYFAMNCLTTAWMVCLSRAVTGDRVTRGLLIGALISLLSAYLLFHCPGTFEPIVSKSSVWIFICLAISPFSCLSYLSSRCLMQLPDANEFRLTFWNGIILGVFGVGMIIFGSIINAPGKPLSGTSWVLLVVSNLTAIAYVPIHFAALRSLSTLEKNFWMLFALGASGALVRLVSILFSSAEVNWIHLSEEIVGIALYVFGAYFMVYDSQKSRV